jgi:hypothetical protein
MNFTARRIYPLGHKRQGIQYDAQIVHRLAGLSVFINKPMFRVYFNKIQQTKNNQ